MYLVIFLIIYLCWLLKILNLINNKLELIIIKIDGIKNNLIEINKKEKKINFLKKIKIFLIKHYYLKKIKNFILVVVFFMTYHGLNIIYQLNQ